MDVGVFEARNRFSELVEAAERGEDVTVSRYGKPVVKIVAVASMQDDLAARRLKALEEIAAINARIVARNGREFTHEELISARDEGRR